MKSIRTELLIHPEELDERWIKRAKKLSLDRLTIHPWGGKTAHLSLEKMLEELKTPRMRSLIDRLCDAGIEIGYEFHAGSYLLDRGLFDTHPEYFRANANGERVREKNFCYSNEEALKIVAENAKKLAKRLYRSSNDYFFWLDDSKDMRCHCEKCSRLTVSDHQLTVMNTVLGALREENPNARLCYLAYYETMELPKAVKPSDGIFLEYAPIERDLTAPLSTADTAALDGLHSLVSFFGKEGAKVLEYWYDNSLFSRWKKPPVRFTVKNDVVKADVELYSSLGFESIASFACFLGEDYVELYGEPDLTGFEKSALST